MPLYCTQGHENKIGSRFCLCCGETLWLPPGQILENRYRILHQLGQGNFGRTYLAEYLHTSNDRCVVKEFAPQIQDAEELKKAQQLFEREAGALHQLNHPQVPRFRELLRADLGDGIGCLFLAQDYVEGQTYWELFKSGKRFSEAEVTQFLCNLLPILSYIHSKRVIHRDISPDNLILRHSDQMPVLIDFGGVKQLASTALSQFMQLGEVPTRLGKPGYSPEEQVRSGQVFPNSDLYALAVTALVLLTGKKPQELYDSHNKTWLWGREISISPTQERILKKMLAAKVGDRYSEADEVLQALKSSPPLQNPNISQVATVIIAPHGNPQPTPSPTPPQNSNNRDTLVVAPGSNPPANLKVQLPATQISTPTPGFSWLNSRWVSLMLGTGVVLVAGMLVWGVVKPFIYSIGSLPVVEKPPSTTPAIAQTTRIEKIFQRREALGIKQNYFNNLVDKSFYAKHPQLKGRQLKSGSEDAAGREEWYTMAENLLDKLEQDKLSTGTRRK